MSFMDFLFGKGEKVQKIPNYNPQQENIMNQMLQGGQQQLPQIYDYLNQILSQNPEMMQQFEAPAMRQFNEQIIPSIAERFSGMGAQKSSAFGQQLGQAGAGLSENLAAQRANLGQNAIQHLQQLLGGGLTQRHENIYRPQSFGAIGSLLQGGLQGVGQLGSLWGGKKLGILG